MKVRVKVDPQLCIGAASCIILDNDHYELNTMGKAEVKATEAEAVSPEAKAEAQKNGHVLAYELELELADEAAKNRLLEGARSCPTQAIFVYDEAGLQLFPA